jgi:hypothetical protein
LETDIRVKRVELLIETGEEMKEYVRNLSEINDTREKNKLPAMYAASKEERQDINTGEKYSVLAVYKMGMDKSNPRRPMLFQEVVPVNADGTIKQESNQLTKMASVVFTSGQIEHYQKIRGLKLKAATMNAHAGEFDFEGE